MKLLKAACIAAVLALPLLALNSCGSHRHTVKTARHTREVYTSLKGALATAEITLLKDSIRVLFPRNLMFDFGKAAVRRELNPTLESFANVLQQYYRTKIFIVGRTDSVGDQISNQQLSERRADSVRAVLHYYGVKDQRMEHWGVGAKDPIADNATEEGRARNRSVEFIVLINH